LSHLLNLEMPPTDLACSSCGYVKAGFCCFDCYGSHWWCQSCLISCHAQHLFHRPQQWKEGSFENVPLCDLGYVFILGHSSSGGSCPEDDNLFGNGHMTVIHVNGVFKHCIRFCCCPGATLEHEQLFLPLAHSVYS
jgi:CxC2 like cysteine cluster associated with KDZ transposases